MSEQRSSNPVDQLGLNLGAREGMRRAVEHADREDENWSERALRYLVAYLEQHPPRWRFIAPQVRQWAIARGLTAPATNYAWGAVIRAAKLKGIITPDGYEQHGDDKMHTQPVRAWRAVK